MRTLAAIERWPPSHDGGQRMWIDALRNAVKDRRERATRCSSWWPPASWKTPSPIRAMSRRSIATAIEAVGS